MALPILEKTWQFDANRAATVGFPALWWTLKDGLKSFPLAPWTVVGSSNSIAASGGFPMDGVDRWIAPANVVIANPGAPHAWIVLAQTGVAAGFQICLEPGVGGGGNPNDLRVVVSPSAGFGSLAVGTVFTRPTAIDELEVYTGPTMGNINNVVARPQMLMSTDGSCTRLLGFSGGFCLLWLAFEQAKNPVPGWSIPWLAMHAISAGGFLDLPNYGAINSLSNRITGKQGAVAMPFFASTEGYASAMLGQNVTFSNDLDSNGWPLSPMGVVCTTPTVRGRHGQFFDLWFGSTAINTGDNYPSDASRQFVQAGDVVFPWNGSTILRT